MEPFAAQAAAAELYGDRFVAACRAARRWAVAHPQQWALLYGSPVPGYAAPQQTIGPAARLPMALVRLAQQALEAGQISVGNSESLPPELSRQSLALAQALGTNLPDWLLFRAGECFTHLMGTISAELFGHLVGSFDPADALAEHLWRQLAGRMGFAGFAARS